MQPEQINHRANPDANLLVTAPRAIWGRPLAVAAAVLFLISSAFPVVAGLSKNTASFPKWWGRLDVGLALVLAIQALAIMALAEGKVTRQAPTPATASIGFSPMASS